MVIAPKIVRPGLPYAVSVNLLKSDETEHIVRVEIRTIRNETVGARAVSNVKTGVPQTITIENLSSDSLLADQDYKVYFRAETANAKILYEAEHPVKCSQKAVSIFVQTDKAIYKPNSTVFYRVVVVTPNLSPYNEEINVRIVDPVQNTISQLLNLQLVKGTLIYFYVSLVIDNFISIFLRKPLIVSYSAFFLYKLNLKIKEKLKRKLRCISSLEDNFLFIFLILCLIV